MKELKYNDRGNIMLLDDKYMLWLKNFMDKYKEFDDMYFIHNCRDLFSKDDLININNLQNLFKELNKYSVKNNLNYNFFLYLLHYENYLYEIFYNGECYCCNRYDLNTYINNKIELPIIEYKDLKKQYTKQMELNFELLKDRVVDSLKKTDLDFIKVELSKLKEPTIFSGVGGSSVVSEFGSKMINKKNDIISVNMEPRDFVYSNINNYKNIISCSYSGNNYGVQLSFDNTLNKYLLSNNSFDDNNITYLKYNTKIGSENSFISLGATLIPVSILMNYYLGNNSFIDEIHNVDFNFDTKNNIYEIFSGYDTSVSSKYLESTMVESGIGIPIVHDKYSYCHGRSTLGVNYNSTVIYFNKNTELDKLLMNELKKYHKDIVVIESRFDDMLLDDYQMLVQSMYLTKYIAEKRSKDLSKVEYSPIVKKLYKYNGNL